MGYYAGAHDLRNLLAVAAMLRRLADDTLHAGDCMLYRTAAAALEARATRLADSMPDERQEEMAALHSHIDMIV